LQNLAINLVDKKNTNLIQNLVYQMINEVIADISGKIRINVFIESDYKLAIETEQDLCSVV